MFIGRPFKEDLEPSAVAEGWFLGMPKIKECLLADFVGFIIY